MATYRIPNNYALICPQPSERADTPSLCCFIVNEKRLRLGMTLPLHSLILDILQLLDFNLSPSGSEFRSISSRFDCDLLGLWYPVYLVQNYLGITSLSGLSVMWMGDSLVASREVEL